jgi:hypothetical protein
VEETLEGGESATEEPIEDYHVLKATLLYFEDGTQILSATAETSAYKDGAGSREHTAGCERRVYGPRDIGDALLGHEDIPHDYREDEDNNDITIRNYGVRGVKSD